MSKDELIDRLHRIYAAVDEAVEGDISKFPPKVISDAKGFALYQDFLGGLNASQVANLAHSLVHNIANLHDHLKRWARKNGHDPKRIDQALETSAPLQIIKDLSNNDKHGYPPRNGGHSGKAPKLVEAKRVMRLTTAAKAGSFVGMILTPSGPKQIGDGSSAVIVTGQIVDADGKVVGDLYDISLQAVVAWEQELKSSGVIT